MKKIVLFIAAFICFSANAGNSLSFDDVLKIQSREVLTVVVASTYDGILASNAVNKLQNGNKLYCPPGDKEFSINELTAIAGEFYIKLKKPDYPFSLYLLYGLIDRFPCVEI